MAKKSARLVVGKWNEDGNFYALAEQPDAELTEMADMVSWCKVNLEPGEYHFVRKVSGSLLIAVQTQMKFTFVEG